MRAVALALLLVASTAAADKKLQQMTPGFEREAQSCKIQVSGLEKVQTQTATLVPSLSPEDKAALDKDLEVLANGLVTVKAYCTEVTELAAFLKTNAAAAYRSVEAQLDARDNKVRKLRKDSKKAIGQVQPITRRWIGRIAQAQTQTPVVVEKRTPGTFPSGRAVELPALPGSFKLSGTATGDTVEYADKAWTATVFVRSFKSATCDQQKRLLPAEASFGDIPKATEMPEGVEASWIATSHNETSYAEAVCVNGKAGGWLGTVTVRPDRNPAANPLRLLMIRMVATLVAQKTP